LVRVWLVSEHLFSGDDSIIQRRDWNIFALNDPATLN
jgi:hypothetical protein